MIKLSRILFATALMAATSLTFLSCSKDYDEKNDGNNGGGKDDARSHAYVDLGLPSGTLWATCNVGATVPEEYGDYFAWGETETKEIYATDSCKWYRVAYSDLQTQGVIDVNGNLTSKYDAATANWGRDWRMPTLDEIEELLTLEYEYVESNGVKGRKFIGKNGNTLFLPFAGRRYNDKLYYAGEDGYYWSATAYENDDYNAYRLGMYSKGAGLDRDYRDDGFSVRPVLRTK